MLRPFPELSFQLLDILQIRPMLPENLAILRPSTKSQHNLGGRIGHPTRKENMHWAKQHNRNRSFNRGK